MTKPHSEPSACSRCGELQVERDEAVALKDAFGQKAHQLQVRLNELRHELAWLMPARVFVDKGDAAAWDEVRDKLKKLAKE
jgi:hypothetical protein